MTQRIQAGSLEAIGNRLKPQDPNVIREETYRRQKVRRRLGGTVVAVALALASLGAYWLTPARSEHVATTSETSPSLQTDHGDAADSRSVFTGRWWRIADRTGFPEPTTDRLEGLGFFESPDRVVFTSCDEGIRSWTHEIVWDDTGFSVGKQLPNSGKSSVLIGCQEHPDGLESPFQEGLSVITVMTDQGLATLTSSAWSFSLVAEL